MTASAETIGMKVEGWVCYGMPDAPLPPEQRAEIVEFALGFEECNETREWLDASDDHHLIRTAYQAMADYARGQM